MAEFVTIDDPVLVSLCAAFLPQCPRAQPRYPRLVHTLCIHFATFGVAYCCFLTWMRRFSRRTLCAGVELNGFSANREI